MRFDDVFLAGIGTYLPPTVSTEHAVEKSWYDPADRDASGMAAVMVAGELPAPEMAARAARVALARAGHAADDFGALLHSDSFHQGPDGWSAPHYVLRATLEQPITAIEIRQGCLGMIAGLEMAAHRLIADRGKDAVLLTAADNFSTPLVDRWRASRMFLLADGAAATVVSRRGGFARVLAAGSVSDPSMEELHRGGEELFPPGVTVGRGLNFEERSDHWRRLWAQGIAPPMGNFGDCVAEVAERTLAEAGTSMEKIVKVCHTGFARGALGAMFLDPLGIDLDRSMWEFTRTVGHAGAGDLFIQLEHLWTGGALAAGEQVLLVGSAPGMEAGCAVIEITTPYAPDEEE
ncbi:ketoacyl-ACP synthase III family protein [Nonomuraea sp. K274]|uniref:Ketoacyl-ACP synthase III family protein n=1 Tax=Nonomuraea cypriaca TaxID=1187855 RepID=A0A931F4X4_9ACTN|nr:ketoacyl-ACP synthase III family protein [Nonomuraea cypriaca]MBF8191541.1 ketoacyl-ACP synthase III family protein [Nonomuraea cypriaca]